MPSTKIIVGVARRRYDVQVRSGQIGTTTKPVRARRESDGCARSWSRRIARDRDDTNRGSRRRSPRSGCSRAARSERPRRALRQTIDSNRTAARANLSCSVAGKSRPGSRPQMPCFHVTLTPSRARRSRAPRGAARVTQPVSRREWRRGHVVAREPRIDSGEEVAPRLLGPGGF